MTRPRWHRFLRQQTSGHRKRMLAGALLIIGQTLLVIALPWPTKLAVDYVLAGDPLPAWAQWMDELPMADDAAGLLFYLGLLIVLLAFANGCFTVAHTVWRRSLGVEMSHEFAGSTLEIVQRQSLRSLALRRARTGDIVQRVVADTKSVDTLVFGVWFTLFQSLVTLVLLGGVIALMTGRLAAVAIISALPMLWATRAFRDRLQDDAEGLAEAQGHMSTGVEQMLTAVPEIQAFAAEDAELDRFRRDLDQQFSASLKYQLTSMRFGLSTSAITAIGTGLVIYFGGTQVLEGSLTVGELLVFLAYLAVIYAPIEGLAYVTQSVATARAGALRVMELTAEDHELPVASCPKRLRAAQIGISVQFDDVCFRYRDEQPILDHIDLEVPAGQWVAIVGTSGAGKTTLASLVPRLFDPQSGAISIDGVDVRDLRLRDVRRRVALAQQDPLLLPVSVADNIRYGTPWATDSNVRAASDTALCTRFIKDLPEGFDTVIGEQGITLSGGQRQRLAIARALCRNAPILILDEPTAALDAHSEAELLARLRSSAVGRTTFIVAHRLSTVRCADRIVVLDEGSIVEDGTHDELVDQNGIYGRYVSLQSSRRASRVPEGVGA